MTKGQIEVTAEDIGVALALLADFHAGFAVPPCGCRCPIAVAVARQEGVKMVHVYAGNLQILVGKKAADIPVAMRAYMQEFDVKMRAEPAVFSVEWRER